MEALTAPEAKDRSVRPVPRVGLPLVLLATALLYLPSLFAGFTNFDDDAYVYENPDVRAPNLGVILDPRHLTASDWTPVVTLTHSLEYRLFGLNPLPYHATNLILHLVCTALVYAFLRDLGVRAREATLAALIFGVHPLQVESIAWISARKNLLALAFGLGFTRLVLAGRSGPAALCLAAALGSKGTAVVFPFAAAAAVALRAGTPSLRIAPAWWGVFALAGLARALLSQSAQAAVIATRVPTTLAERMANMGVVLPRQLRQFFYPFDLCAEYPMRVFHWNDPTVIAGWTLVVVTAGVVLHAGRRDAAVAAAGIWVGLGMLPTLNIWPAPFFQADRYTHIAMVGAAWLVVRALAPLRRFHPWLVSAVVTAWCLFVAAPIARARIAVWHDSQALWRDTVRQYPNFAFAWQMLAADAWKRNDLSTAETALRRSLALAPDQPDVQFNLASVLHRSGSAAAALGELHVLLARHPDHAAGHRLLGVILLGQGDAAAALAAFDTSLRVQPDSPRTRLQRCRALLQVGRLRDADGELEQLVRRGGDSASVWALQSELRLRQGQPVVAAELARRTTQEAPELAEGWERLGEALLAVGDLNGAEAALARALVLAGDSADVHYQVARLAERRGDAAGARQAALRALQRLGTASRAWVTAAERLAE